MSAEELVIDLVEEFRPGSARRLKITEETKQQVEISFFIQDNNMVWYKVEGQRILKKYIKEISRIDIGKQ